MLDCRDVTKISNCRLNTTNGWGIKQLRISFGSIFLLFYMKVAGSHVHGSWGKPPAPPLNDSLGFIIIIIILLFYCKLTCEIDTIFNRDSSCTFQLP